MNSEDLSSFTNSPVVQRCLDIKIDLDETLFESEIPNWLAKVAENGQYNAQDIRQFWMFRIEDAGGIPKPKARLYQIPQLLNKIDSKPVMGIEVVPSIETDPLAKPLPQVLRFSQWRQSEDVTRFSALESEVERWTPDFIESFGLDHLGGITLRYVNDIGLGRFPDLWANGKLSLSKILSFIPSPNGQVAAYQAPFKIETNQPVGNDAVLKINFESAAESGFNVVFEYSSLSAREDQPLSEALKELDSAHKLILSQFQAQFSEDALNCFQG